MNLKRDEIQDGEEDFILKSEQSTNLTIQFTNQTCYSVRLSRVSPSLALGLTLVLHVECGMTNERSESTETESSDSLIKHGYGPGSALTLCCRHRCRRCRPSTQRQAVEA